MRLVAADAGDDEQMDVLGGGGRGEKEQREASASLRGPADVTMRRVGRTLSGSRPGRRVVTQALACGDSPTRRR